MRPVLAALSGLLLSIPFLDPDYFALTWVGFIPLLIAIKGQKYSTIYLLGSVTGIIFSTNISYWMVDFLILSKGYQTINSVLVSCLFWFYSAQLFSIMAVVFKWLKRKSQLHESIVFPLVVVSLFALYPMLFSAHLGQSQNHFLIALQAVEFFGVYGLDAVIALSNIILFRLIMGFLTNNRELEVIPKKIFTLHILLIASWFFYGWSSNLEWEQKLANFETASIGLVQPNETPSLAKQVLYPGYSRAFPPEMAMTQRLADIGAELVIWPEAKYKAYFDQPKIAEAYQHQLEQLNTHLIFQDIERIETPLNSAPLQYNSAVMITNNGEPTATYRKMQRIAFGEYVPFADDFPILKRWVESYFGKFFNEMQQGESFQVFNGDLVSPLSKISQFNIIPLICYETTFPKFVASAVSQAMTSTPSKLETSANLIVALSSDGWFGSTHQPYQHVNSSVLRAVENRLPLIHVLNNGPSIVAMPNGQIIFQSEINKAGGYLVDVPLSEHSKGSFFSKYPFLFIGIIYILLILVTLRAFLNRSK